MKKLRTAALVITALVLCFIWTQSAIPRDLSKSESLKVGGFITPFLEIFFGKGSVTDHIVRKTAHFVEYFVLGCSMETVIFTRKRKIYITVMSAFLAAFIDETIQIFSGRGPMIADVWLDMFGAVTGIAAAAGVLLLMFKSGLKKKRTDEL